MYDMNSAISNKFSLLQVATIKCAEVSSSWTDIYCMKQLSTREFEPLKKPALFGGKHLDFFNQIH